MSFLSYLFWPRPPLIAYSSPKMQALLVFCAALVLLSVGIKRWRRKQKNPMTRKLSRSWGAAALWFGLVGLLLGVSRAEDISFLSMRFWWIVWLGVLLLYLFLQVRLYRSRHYVQLPSESVEDPREKYLPSRKRK